MWANSPQCVVIPFDLECKAISLRHARFKNALLTPFAFHLFYLQAGMTRILHKQFELFVHSPLQVLREVAIITFEGFSAENLPIISSNRAAVLRRL